LYHHIFGQANKNPIYKVVSSEMDRGKSGINPWVLTKNRPDFQLDLSIPQGMKAVQSYHASLFKSLYFF